MGKLSGKPVHIIINKVGGFSIFSKFFGISESTVRSWAARGRVPSDYYFDFLAIIAKQGFSLDEKTKKAVLTGVWLFVPVVEKDSSHESV